MKLNAIIAALPSLSQPELLSIRAACDHLIATPDTNSDDTTPLYDAMAKLLGVGLSYRDFHNVVSYRAWRKAAPSVVAFIDENWPDATRIVKLALMTLMLEALRDDLRERGIPVSLGTMTTNLSTLPECFDRCFPGYRETGMAHMVLDAITKKE
jgi:hypothetical protein